MSDTTTKRTSSKGKVLGYYTPKQLALLIGEDTPVAVGLKSLLAVQTSIALKNAGIVG